MEFLISMVVELATAQLVHLGEQYASIPTPMSLHLICAPVFAQRRIMKTQGKSAVIQLLHQSLHPSYWIFMLRKMKLQLALKT
jgi:hypothetical protein